MDRDELEEILAEHKVWVNTGGIMGKRADLRDSDLSGLSLSKAELGEAKLARANLANMNLSCANLKYANLSRANLQGASLVYANINLAELSGAKLRGADFGINRIPVIEDIHKKIWGAVRDGGLAMENWHSCESTHCRAGWAIHLAGECGYLLESIFGPSVAGALIYQASDPGLERVPDWHASDEDALADIKRMAGVS